jgi:hypothetical protein
VARRFEIDGRNPGREHQVKPMLHGPIVGVGFCF